MDIYHTITSKHVIQNPPRKQKEQFATGVIKKSCVKSSLSLCNCHRAQHALVSSSSRTDKKSQTQVLLLLQLQTQVPLFRTCRCVQCPWWWSDRWGTCWGAGHRQVRCPCSWQVGAHCVPDDRWGTCWGAGHRQVRCPCSRQVGAHCVPDDRWGTCWGAGHRQVGR